MISLVVAKVLLGYESESAQTIFTDFDVMKKEIGIEKTRAIKKRLDQLEASMNFGIYLSTGLGRPHPLTGNLKGYYGINITGNVRLTVKPDSEGLDPESLKNCDTVIIKGVMDYHGKKDEWLIP